jgi:hypothetical protein
MIAKEAKLSAQVTRLADTSRGPRVRVTFSPSRSIEIDVGPNESLGEVVQRADMILKGLS